MDTQLQELIDKIQNEGVETAQQRTTEQPLPSLLASAILYADL